jgi:hypothetical protein
MGPDQQPGLLIQSLIEISERELTMGSWPRFARPGTHFFLAPRFYQYPFACRLLSDGGQRETRFFVILVHSVAESWQKRAT